MSFVMFPNDYFQQFINCRSNIFHSAAWKYMAENSTTNCAISPLIAEITLILIAMGAEPITANEIQASLGYKTRKPEEITPLVDKVLVSLSETTEGFFLKITNKIYVNRKYKIKRVFVELAISYFCDVEPFSFATLPPNHPILNYGPSITAGTKIIVVNDLYFKAKWDIRFKTQDRMTYYVKENQTLSVESMRSIWYYNVCDHEELDAKLVEVEFEKRKSSMVFIVPNQINGLSEVEKKIDLILNSPYYFQKTPIDLLLPKFMVRAQIGFKELLQNCGIRQMFESSNGHLNGVMYEGPNIHVNDFVQDFIMKVDENGVSIDEKSPVDQTLEASWLSPMAIVVNRPFAFFIKVHGLIVFVGRVVDQLFDPTAVAVMESEDDLEMS